MVEKHVEPAYDLNADESFVAHYCNGGLEWLKAIDLYGARIVRNNNLAVVR